MMNWFKNNGVPALRIAAKRRQLDRTEQWLEILRSSDHRPVVLFKHSRRCGLSSLVLKRFEERFLTDEFQYFSYYLLDILQHRHISDQVARDLGIAHESPQVILISEGGARIDASHYDIMDVLDSFREIKGQMS